MEETLTTALSPNSMFLFFLPLSIVIFDSFAFKLSSELEPTSKTVPVNLTPLVDESSFPATISSFESSEIVTSASCEAEPPFIKSEFWSPVNVISFAPDEKERSVYVPDFPEILVLVYSPLLILIESVVISAGVVLSMSPIIILPSLIIVVASMPFALTTELPPIVNVSSTVKIPFVESVTKSIVEPEPVIVIFFALILSAVTEDLSPTLRVPSSVIVPVFFPSTNFCAFKLLYEVMLAEPETYKSATLAIP